MAGGGVVDRHIQWKAGRLWLPIHTFQGLDNNGTSTISLSQGTPTVEATSGPSELVSIPMNTADEAHTIIPVPWDLKRTGYVAARVYFIHASTDASDAPVFIVGSNFMAKQATVPELKGGAETTTTITHGGTSATDDSLELTPWELLAWKDYINELDVLIGLTLELDALGSASTDEPEILGLEIAYDIEACKMNSYSVSNLVDNNDI